MAKPPVDADPEKFIIGRGMYTNTLAARVHCDGKVVRIDPAPMPVASIFVCNAIFAAAFFGFHWLLKYYTEPKPGPWAIYGAPIAIGLMTCGLFTGFTIYEFDDARRRGTWLIYDKGTKRVDLPRERLSFDRSEILHIQYITTKRLGWLGENDRLSELNLITCRDGVRRRWPLLRSIASIGAFDTFLKPILDQTDLPVMRVMDETSGWKVTETPYGVRKV